MKAGAAAAAGLAGLLVVLGGVAALSFGSARDAEARDDWRPICAAHHGWGDMDVVVATDQTSTDNPPTARRSPRWVLFGLDLSPSNRALAEGQLAEITNVMADLPPDVGTSALLVSDRSDLSDTPDLPLQRPASPAVATTEVAVTGIDCWPHCETDSLAAQGCLEQVEAALDQRRAAVTERLRAEQTAATAQAQAKRREKVRAWSANVGSWRPRRPGTSIIRFFAKIADLPPVRDDPDAVTLFLLSDLEEARTEDRRTIERVVRHHERHGTCPADVELPPLEGLHVVLVQSVQARVNADRWADRWTTVLTCAGARVEVRRYSSAVPLAQLVDLEVERDDR